MSIISEALKKAQKERTTIHGSSPIDATGDPMAASSAERSQNIPLNRSSLRYPLMIAVPVAAILTMILVVPHLVAPRPGPAVAPKPASIRQSGESPVRDKAQKTEPARTESYRPSFPLFRSPDLTAHGNAEPVLNGIMYLPTSPRAVINGRTVKEGDAFDGYTVIQILPDRVKLSSGDDKLELELR